MRHVERIRIAIALLAVVIGCKEKTATRLYEEIAVATDAQLGTVKSRLSRARAKLRDYLKSRELLPAQYR